MPLKWFCEGKIMLVIEMKFNLKINPYPANVENMVSS
jgi:hypothetical protein